MSKIDPAGIDIALKPTEISALIQKVEDAMRPKLQPGVVLNHVLGANEYVVNTDPSRVSQVLMNLLSNACRFTERGAITFGYEIYDDELYFFVKDTGKGLDNETKDRLNLLIESDTFQPGTGLGLPISRAIVLRLNGQTGFESRGPGRGSTFWFTIPNEAAELPSSEKPKEEEVEETTEANSKPVMLVAEDNESNFFLFRSILEQDYNIVRAHDGLEAVEQFRNTNPDVILMDINMPNLDGYGAVKEIRKISTTVPIIAVTAYAFVTDRQRILENGFNSYVSKPINVNRLEREIKKCLGVDDNA